MVIERVKKNQKERSFKSPYTALRKRIGIRKECTVFVVTFDNHGNANIEESSDAEPNHSIN
jgi:hypothetical protein